MRRYLVSLCALAVPLGTVLGQGSAVPAPQPARVVQAALKPDVPAAAPAPVITLYDRHGHVTPTRRGCNHTGAGNIDIAQPTPDTVIITMTGVAVATGHPCKDSVASQDFDLEQCIEIALDNPAGKKLKLAMEGRVIGLLRSHSHSKGVASESGACATVACGPVEVLTVCAPEHSVSCGESLSINDHAGPVSVPVAPGRYTLHQVFHVAVTHPQCVLPCKAASAEFAPDPALDPLWISYWEPFHGASKKDFGFQVILKVTVE